MLKLLIFLTTLRSGINKPSWQDAINIENSGKAVWWNSEICGGEIVGRSERGKSSDPTAAQFIKWTEPVSYHSDHDTINIRVALIAITTNSFHLSSARRPLNTSSKALLWQWELIIYYMCH